MAMSKGGLLPIHDLGKFREFRESSDTWVALLRFLPGNVTRKDFDQLISSLPETWDRLEAAGHPPTGIPSTGRGNYVDLKYPNDG